MATLKSLRLAGWKSVRDAEITFGRVNVLIGANGSGKSNLISYFRMLHELAEERLQLYVATAGGASSLLHFGPKQTPKLESELRFEGKEYEYRYIVRLIHAAVDTFVFENETGEAWRSADAWREAQGRAGGHRETALADWRRDLPPLRPLWQTLASCLSYHFTDTSASAPVRQRGYAENNRHLMSDGGNLAAMLYRFKCYHLSEYNRILAAVRQISPFFEDFELFPSDDRSGHIVLNWREKGAEAIFGPHQISDGTLRAMALITLLLQPEELLPQIIVIDVPELGLHPYALGVIASLIKKASYHAQVIIATQSPALLDHFEPEDVIVADRKGKETEFRRLSSEELQSWLEEYTLSELWEKNVIGGGPH